MRVRSWYQNRKKIRLNCSSIGTLAGDLLRQAALPTEVCFGRADENEKVSQSLVNALRRNETSCRPRVLLVTTLHGHDRHGGYLSYQLQRSGCEIVPFTVPDVRIPSSAINDACSIGMRSGCTAVVGAGGSALMDISKLIAAALKNTRSSSNNRMKELSGCALEMQGLKESSTFTAPSAPLVLFPTSVSTGTEVTNLARISDGDDWLTFSSKILLPSLVVYDEELLKTLTRNEILVQGLASLTQSIEAAFEAQAGLSLYLAENIEGNGADSNAERSVISVGNQTLAVDCALAGVRAATLGISEILQSSSTSMESNAKLAHAAALGACASASTDRGIAAGVASLLVSWGDDDDGNKLTKPRRSHAQAAAAMLPFLVSFEGERWKKGMVTEGDHIFGNVLQEISNGARLNGEDRTAADVHDVVKWIEKAMEVADVLPLLHQGHGISVNDTSAIVEKLLVYDKMWTRGLSVVEESGAVLGVTLGRTSSSFTSRGLVDDAVTRIITSALE
eukprot:g2854.t1